MVLLQFLTPDGRNIFNPSTFDPPLQLLLRSFTMGGERSWLPVPV